MSVYCVVNVTAFLDALLFRSRISFTLTQEVHGYKKCSKWRPANQQERWMRRVSLTWLPS